MHILDKKVKYIYLKKYVTKYIFIINVNIWFIFNIL